MKRERPADDIRRRAIKARLKGMPSREIARNLERSHDTIKGYLGSCGVTIKGTYYLNALAAEALFNQNELLELGAVWNGRCWVGPGHISPADASDN
ncbi:MAG TPA: hypothetical protein VFR19_11810 [Hyphomicrobiaceae bacterium]|jgi:hypothetical protein|nr:hypothetical protein [Hyphomicrobiaceae bacterium]